MIDLTSDFLLIIIVVAGREELSKDERRHVDLLHLVLHHRDSLPIIPHTDGVVLPKKHIYVTIYILEMNC